MSMNKNSLLPAASSLAFGVVNAPASGEPTHPRPSRMFRRAALAAGLAMVVSSTGCSFVSNARKSLSRTECIDDFISNHRNEVMAEKAWYRVQSCYQNHCCVKDFRAGFIAGYMEVADGGSGCTPTVVDSSYWGWKHRGPEGQNCINAWFEGFPLGVKAAEQDGVGFHNQIRVEGPPSCATPMMTGTASPTPAGSLPLAYGPDGTPRPPAYPGYPVPGAAPLSGVPADPILDAPAGAAMEAPPAVFRDRTDRPIAPRAPSVLPDGIDADLPYSATPFTPPPVPPPAPGYGPFGSTAPEEPLPPGVRLNRGERIVPGATVYREVGEESQAKSKTPVSITSPSDQPQPKAQPPKAQPPKGKPAAGNAAAAGLQLPAWLKDTPQLPEPTPSVMSFTDQSPAGPSARVATAPAKVQVRVAEPPSGLSPGLTLPPPPGSRPLDAQPTQAEIDEVINEIFGRSNP